VLRRNLSSVTDTARGSAAPGEGAARRPGAARACEEQRLGFVATAAPDGTPNVSPQGTFVVLDNRTIAFGEIRSPGTIRNLRANPRTEVNFVNVFVRKSGAPNATSL
jgi:predicted pyridoxine 5'-phosphate oxidase superfamily flavin-nucleotide-binding protein